MRKEMPETECRASRRYRILGNPTAYQIIKSLFKGTRKSSDFADEVGLSIQTISIVLAKLRNVVLVRHEDKINERIYWLKHRALIRILLSLGKLVRYILVQKW